MHAPTTGGAAPTFDINSALGLVKPAYSRYVYLGASLGVFAALVLLGMPLVPAIGGAALAYILADEFLRGKARKARLAIEGELPTFVSRLGGMLLVTSAPAWRSRKSRRPFCPAGRCASGWSGCSRAGRARASHSSPTRTWRPTVSRPCWA